MQSSVATGYKRISSKYPAPGSCYRNITEAPYTWPCLSGAYWASAEKSRTSSRVPDPESPIVPETNEARSTGQYPYHCILYLKRWDLCTWVTVERFSIQGQPRVVLWGHANLQASSSRRKANGREGAEGVGADLGGNPLRMTARDDSFRIKVSIATGRWPNLSGSLQVILPG